jgi:hypothetical protein
MSCIMPRTGGDAPTRTARRAAMKPQMNEATMFNARTLAACAFGVALLTPGLGAQDLLPSRRVGEPRVAQYRNFALKSDLATVSTSAGVQASDAKMIHERPAVLQNLDWRPSRWVTGSTVASTDPVDQLVFSFYNDQLYRVVVDYARDRTEGMTDADMIEAIAAAYGAPSKPASRAVRAVSGIEAESGTVVARWGGPEHTVVLYRASTYGDGFRLIVTEPHLDRLAQRATADAVRLDERDAPRVELERQKKERDDTRATAEKARVVNKAGFRP